MEQDKFINDFKSQFIDSDEIAVDASTEFRKIGSWDSLTGMAVLVMIKDEYGVDMGDTDLKKCNTVEDIFEFVSSKK
ncbi:MAG: acyl carrier protein [Segetibacter sp.]|nr:acyl carrier protein [Segetibacter sp.]